MRVRNYELWIDNEDVEPVHKTKKGKILKKLRDTEKKELIPVKVEKRRYKE